MKKLAKLLSLLLVAFLCFSLTSCDSKTKNGRSYEVIRETTFSSEDINDLFKKAHDDKQALLPEADRTQYKPVVYLGLYDSVNHILYLENAVVPAGKYELIEKGNGLPTIEGEGFFGPYFAGWYQTNEFRNAENGLNVRLVTFNDFEKDADHIVYANTIDFVEAIIVAVICIVIVFGMLMLLWGLVTLLKFVAPKQKQQEQVKPVVVKPQAAQVKKAISLEDIKDEEMMAAALVATIDYHEETKEDVRIVSIKEIK